MEFEREGLPEDAIIDIVETEDHPFTEGKTKALFSVLDEPQQVVIWSKDDITADNDPAKTKQFAGKAVCSTVTTVAVFKLLEAAGIPTAFLGGLRDDHPPCAFLAKKCRMILLEVIARRKGTGSFLNRNPQLENYSRFSRLRVEFFLKTTGGGLVYEEKQLVSGLTSKQEDPWITNPFESPWKIVHPKVPTWVDESDLGVTLDSREIGVTQAQIKEMYDITRRVAYVLEAAWSTLGYQWIDFKIEFGITGDGQLVVADVIDNDSWRLLDRDGQEMSKQLFRDGGDLVTIQQRYSQVAHEAERFESLLMGFPQAIVFWRGSTGDDWPDSIAKGLGLDLTNSLSTLGKDNAVTQAFPVTPLTKAVFVTESAHKRTEECLRHLNDLHGEFLGGGVIVDIVGMSNGLGPTVSARTLWPTINVPAHYETHPEDIFSSLRLPSNVPAVTCIDPKNATRTALAHLAARDPIIRARLQYDMETAAYK